MLDGYTHGVPHSWAEYASEVAAAGTKGLSIWRTLDADEWDQWQGILETTSAATY